LCRIEWTINRRSWFVVQDSKITFYKCNEIHSINAITKCTYTTKFVSRRGKENLKDRHALRTRLFVCFCLSDLTASTVNVMPQTLNSIIQYHCVHHDFTCRNKINEQRFVLLLMFKCSHSKYCLYYSTEIKFYKCNDDVYTISIVFRRDKRNKININYRNALRTKGLRYYSKWVCSFVPVCIKHRLWYATPVCLHKQRTWVQLN